MTRKSDPFIAYRNLTETIVSQFGAQCQVSLFDIRGSKAELIAAAGTVHATKIGDPMPAATRKQLSMMRAAQTGRSFFTASTPDGRRLSASITLVTAESGNVIGAFVIELCIENIIASINTLQTFCSVPSASAKPSDATHSDEDVLTLAENIINETFLRARSEGRIAAKEDRIRLIMGLDQKGVFLVKGAVELVAARLNVSKFTIYSDLDRLRSDEGA